MRPKVQILFSGIALSAVLMFFGGCYTQLVTEESAYDEGGTVEDTVVAEAEEFERDYPPPDYYLTFSYYHPGFSVMYSPYDPWYYPGWYSPWYPPYYPAYTCWPYDPYWHYPYYHPVVHNGGGTYGGGYYPNGGPGSVTRDFGSTRGLGDPTGTRGRGGVVRAGGDDDGTPLTFLPTPITRSTRGSGTTVADNTGKKTDSPGRKAAVNRPSTRKVQPKVAPSNSGDSGSSRGGSNRSSVSSPPRSSAPAPSASSGNRGSSSGGGSRGGSPRSR